tara:strand:- start:275 stop:487 length:213 start_codon:yes stop_codon:yes gene_type:complete
MDQVVMYLTETTDWGDTKINNGVYAINKNGQLVAYSNGTSPFKVFNKPMKQFSKARRTFTSSRKAPINLR